MRGCLLKNQDLEHNFQCVHRKMRNNGLEQNCQQELALAYASCCDVVLAPCSGDGRKQALEPSHGEEQVQVFEPYGGEGRAQVLGPHYGEGSALEPCWGRAQA